MTADQDADRDPDTARTARLRRSLRLANEALVWKLVGLSERDQRRPLTPTGTNLLGLVKHVASVESEYFGFVVDRPFPDPPSWLQEESDDRDMWASAEESPEFIIAFAHRVFAHVDETLVALQLDTPGRVPWWGPQGDVTLEQVAVHTLAEVNRHLGHADILRELIDGSAGLRADVSNLADRDASAWSDHVRKLQAIADRFDGPGSGADAAAGR
ncbi:DinB family protein [Nakamurella sp. A5-74]|uniref:DinB family protein n=1 Tax=Nakamurella sp. A5-74 TaxID=3158264 RepID=A0AAU8DJR3_9ACTN